MPRTFKATLFLIGTLVVLSLLTIMNLWQTNSAERTALEVKKQVDALTISNDRIMQRLEQGVGINTAAAGTNPSNANSDRYAAALLEPGNILKEAKHLKIPADAKFGGTLRNYLGDTPKGYNWLTENSVDVANLQAMIHSSFASRDLTDPDRWVPDLAYKATVSDDFLEYTIHLREGVYWHPPAGVDFTDPKNEWLKAPRELTAEDAVFYFELIKNPQVEAGALKSYYEDFESATVVDKYTFKVRWKRKTYNSLDFTIGVYPMPKWLFTKDETGADLPVETLGLQFNNHWASKYAIGTGPYRFLEAKAGERVVLERNGQYFGTRYPIDKIEYSIVKDTEAAYLKVKADEIDVLPSLPPSHYKNDILDSKNSPFTRGDLNHKVIDAFAFYYVGWNADKPLFKDKRVRRAMTHALNRQGIIDNVLFGLGTIQTGPFYYKHPATDKTIQPFPFDLELAKKLLDEAGWTDTDGDGIRDKVLDGQKTKFEFSIVSYDRPEVRTWLSIFKEDLRKVGVNMNPLPVDWPTMQKKMDEGAFDAFTGGWGLSWSIDPYQIWHSTQADVPKGSNRVAFRNKRADEIIETLRVTFDEAERLKMYHEFHAILHEEQPYTFFYAPQQVAVWHPRVKNMVINSIRPQMYSLPWWLDPDHKPKK